MPTDWRNFRYFRDISEPAVQPRRTADFTAPTGYPFTRRRTPDSSAYDAAIAQELKSAGATAKQTTQYTGYAKRIWNATVGRGSADYVVYDGVNHGMAKWLLNVFVSLARQYAYGS